MCIDDGWFKQPHLALVGLIGLWGWCGGAQRCTGEGPGTSDQPAASQGSSPPLPASTAPRLNLNLNPSPVQTGALPPLPWSSDASASQGSDPGPLVAGMKGQGDALEAPAPPPGSAGCTGEYPGLKVPPADRAALGVTLGSLSRPPSCVARQPQLFRGAIKTQVLV
ncbi:unnamed protein product [Boreogadus saida]